MSFSLIFLCIHLNQFFILVNQFTMVIKCKVASVYNLNSLQGYSLLLLDLIKIIELKLTEVIRCACCKYLNTLQDSENKLCV